MSAGSELNGGYCYHANGEFDIRNVRDFMV